MLQKYIVASSLFLMACTSAWAGEAGRVVFTTGQVQLADHAAAMNAVVSEGDEISTGADGYVYVKTVDSGFLILRPNSKARVITYRIDTANAANTHVKLELLSGVVRSISGQGVKAARQNFRFNTPVAAIGVRGTDFIVYTDQTTSRVLVVSGGVVMSAFNGSCAAEGVGPCEGMASRELFAGKSGMMLQVQRGESSPQLLNNPSLSPDQNEKPRSDEPIGKAPSVALTVGQVNLDPQKSALSLSSAVQDTAPPATAVTPPPVLVSDPTPPPAPPAPPAPPVVAKAQEVFWGRWQTVAGTAVMPASIQNNKVDNPSFVGDFAIARLSNAVLVMPKDGTAAFTLTNSQVFVQRTGAAETVGTLDSSRLSINFADRTFDTDLQISSAGYKYDVNGQGVIDLKGAMSSSGGSPTVIRGLLSGPNSEEAAYIFKNTVYPNTAISGGTSWKK